MKFMLTFNKNHKMDFLALKKMKNHPPQAPQVTHAPQPDSTHTRGEGKFSNLQQKGVPVFS